jgi:RimJ/RimL family protein N-acetyltransferase
MAPAPGSATARLDLARYRIRTVAPDDAADLQRFYAELSLEDRCMRFLAARPGLSREEAAVFAAADHRSCEGFVARLREPGARDGELVGHLCVVPAEGGLEFGVAVAEGERRRGLGLALLRAGMAWARDRGVTSLEATARQGNVAMLRLARAAGEARLQDVGGGLVRIELPV